MARGESKKLCLTKAERQAAKALGMSQEEYAAFLTTEGARAWERREHRKQLRQEARNALDGR